MAKRGRQFPPPQGKTRIPTLEVDDSCVIAISAPETMSQRLLNLVKHGRSGLDSSIDVQRTDLSYMEV